MTGDTQPYGYISIEDPAGLLLETRSPRVLNNKQARDEDALGYRPLGSRIPGCPSKPWYGYVSLSTVAINVV